MEKWMVRSFQNVISGPYSKEEVCQMILENKLGPDDEICPSLGYWISIKEREEIRNLLGIDLPLPSRRVHDRNANQVNEEEITDLDLHSPFHTHSNSAETTPSIPSMEPARDSLDTSGKSVNTQKIQNRNLILIGVVLIGILVMVILRLMWR